MISLLLFIFSSFVAQPNNDGERDDDENNELIYNPTLNFGVKTFDEAKKYLSAVVRLQRLRQQPTTMKQMEDYIIVAKRSLWYLLYQMKTKNQRINGRIHAAYKEIYYLGLRLHQTPLELSEGCQRALNHLNFVHTE
jgi:hypothetical protein